MKIGDADDAGLRPVWLAFDVRSFDFARRHLESSSEVAFAVADLKRAHRKAPDFASFPPCSSHAGKEVAHY